MIRKHSAFTLLEIMIVILIIGIISALVFPRLAGRRDQAKRWKAILQIRELQQAVEDFYVDNGFYPSQEEGLEVLVRKPTSDEGSIRWREGGYLRKKDIPQDPWGNLYQYHYPGLEEEPYSIISLGKDGKQGGTGWNRDIVSWKLEEEL